MSEDELSDDEHFDVDLLVRNFEEEANLLKNNLLPPRSKEKYNQAYNNFIKWKDANKASFDENVFLVYFSELSKLWKPPTLWSIWSKLKTTLNLRNNIDINQYKNLKSFLKNYNKGYKPKKSKILSLANIDSFIEQTKDDEFLSFKAIAIVGFFGCLRGSDILTLKLSDFEDVNKHYIVTINEIKTDTSRNFIISSHYYDLVKKYRLLRLKELSDDDRFFVTYQNGKCIKQFMGKNKISEVPKIIAAKLKLPDPHLYTGHCFRRSSATALSDAGGDLVLIKQHGGWKSDNVAQGYIDFSTAKKQKIFNMISNTRSNKTTHFSNHPPVTNLFTSAASGSNNVGASGSNNVVAALENSSNQELSISSNESANSENILNQPSTSNQEGSVNSFTAIQTRNIPSTTANQPKSISSTAAIQPENIHSTTANQPKSISSTAEIQPRNPSTTANQPKSPSTTAIHPRNIHSTAAKNDSEYTNKKSPSKASSNKENIPANTCMQSSNLVNLNNADSSCSSNNFNSLCDEYNEQMLNIDLNTIESEISQKDKRKSEYHSEL